MNISMNFYFCIINTFMSTISEIAHLKTRFEKKPPTFTRSRIYGFYTIFITYYLFLLSVQNKLLPTVWVQYPVSVANLLYFKVFLKKLGVALADLVISIIHKKTAPSLCVHTSQCGYIRTNTSSIYCIKKFITSKLFTK